MSYQVYKEYLERYYGELEQNKTYVVAFFSNHTGIIEQKLVYAKTELQAMNAYLKTEYENVDILYDSLEPDNYINILEINNTLTE